MLCLGLVGAATAAERLPPPTVEVGEVGEMDRSGTARTDARIVTPGSAAAGRDGPAVELITGGRSKDGAAHVGRLPVLD